MTGESHSRGSGRERYRSLQERTIELPRGGAILFASPCARDGAAPRRDRGYVAERERRHPRSRPLLRAYSATTARSQRATRCRRSALLSSVVALIEKLEGAGWPEVWRRPVREQPDELLVRRELEELGDVTRLRVWGTESEPGPGFQFATTVLPLARRISARGGHRRTATPAATVVSARCALRSTIGTSTRSYGYASLPPRQVPDYLQPARRWVKPPHDMRGKIGPCDAPTGRARFAARTAGKTGADDVGGGPKNGQRRERCVAQMAGRHCEEDISW